MSRFQAKPGIIKQEVKMIETIQQIISAVLMILGGASIIAKMTPTEADNKIIQKIENFIHALGLTKRGGK